MRTLSLSTLSVLAILGSAELASARAPDTFEEDYHPPVVIESPMRVSWEFRTGPYNPDRTPWKETFADDHGWLFATEVDITLYKIPYVGQLALGLGFGWSSYSAKAFSVNEDGSLGARSGETTKLTLFPISTLAVLRVDALARHTIVPLTFAGKLGADYMRWKSTTGGESDGKGLNTGLRWGLQAALELDFIDRRAARRLDEDFGINHTYIFGEYMGSRTQSFGDKTYQFGVGVQF
jgi:hypothetical protein